MPDSNEAYRHLLSALHAANIPYALMRDDITARNRIKDLDILIAGNKMDAFHRVAAEQGFICIKDGTMNPGKRVYLKVQNACAHILDVHEKIVWRGITFLDSTAALANRKLKDGFYSLGDEDFLIGLLFHNILAKRCIQKKHSAQLNALFSQKLDLRYLEKQLHAFGLKDLFDEVEKNFAEACENSAFVADIAKQARRKLLLGNPRNLYQTIRLWLLERTVKFIGRKRGIVVAFLGPDGAGKSTMIAAINRRLKEIGLGNKVVYLGPWGGSILPLRRILSFLHLTPYRDDYKAYYKGKLPEKPGALKGFEKVRFQLRSRLYYLLLVIEMRARWRRLVMPLLRRGKIVLSDRYIYDILTGYKNKPMDYHVDLRKKICECYPKPEIGILLDAKPEIIFARKPQLSKAELATSQEAYRKIAAEHGFLTLDTSECVDKSLRDFEDRILPFFYRKLLT